MENVYILIVICLLCLAVFDLVVGVSNDAVNFLNSAFGSQVARRRTILLVASLGIALGAISSGGMMEIARKGIFNPEMFSFADVMTIFLAVMITDILLLDFFNTYGMPTSTTVSLMFELFGAAFVVAVIKIISNGSAFVELGEYLNASNALVIISGIFLSVFIAFFFGIIVQTITRSIFSFRLDQSLKKFGSVFGGFSITTITYYMLIKGLKASILMQGKFAEIIQSQTLLVLASLFVFWTLVCFAAQRFFNANVLKIVVLSGTFALAMAFAGNDLVNFIGVPLAGVNAFMIYQDSGVSGSELSMGMLAEGTETPIYYLVLAGIVMILTLWFSKKAESVTETEINLARESIGKEKFKSNLVSRFFVRSGLSFNSAATKLFPVNVLAKMNKRFDKNVEHPSKAENPPAFDLLRASVNLMLSSVLIASATSLKLPLSTTYVSFMVAMGTSLADRAWDRDSAVYRVAGVVNVITGWLFTAFVAFVSSALLAVSIYFGGIYAIVGLIFFTVFVIYKNHVKHKISSEKQKQNPLNSLLKRSKIDKSEVQSESASKIAQTLYIVGFIYKDSIDGLKHEDFKRLRKAQKQVAKFNHEHEELISTGYYYVQKINSESVFEGKMYLHVLNYLQNISQSIHFINSQVLNHVKNFHKPFEAEKLDELSAISHKVGVLFQLISDYFDQNIGTVQGIEYQSNEILNTIDLFEQRQIERIKSDKSSPKNALLYITILLETRDLVKGTYELIGAFEDRITSKHPVDVDGEFA